MNERFRFFLIAKQILRGLRTPDETFGASLLGIQKEISSVNSTLRGIEHLTRTIGDEQKAYNQNQQAKQSIPQVLNAELQIPEYAQRERRAYDKRQYRVQVWIAVASSLAFIAAAVYAGYARSQRNAMIESNKISRESFVSVQRAFVIFDGTPFITVKKIAPSGQGGIFWQFQPTWENTGPTTATTAVQDFFVDKLLSEPNEQQFIGTNKHHAAYQIGPRAKQEGAIREVADSLIMQTVAHFPDVETVHWKIFFWGWVVYRDVLPETKPHVTEFCSHLVEVNFPITTKQSKDLMGRPPLSSESSAMITWEACDEHNCVDEYCKDYEEMMQFLPK
jgi:hypothetical protein